jgi:alpha-2-macroglobulin
MFPPALRDRLCAFTPNLLSRLWLPIVGLVVAACVTASEIPRPAKLNSLLPKEPESSAASNAFNVVHHGPVGSAGTDATINIVFNKPIRPLNSDDDAPIPITLNPHIDGKWQWVGTHGVQFQPADLRLPLGRSIHVSVPGNLTALTGEQLGTALEYDFSTETPRLETYSPYDGAKSQPLKPSILLSFNQKVDPEELRAKLTLRAAAQAVPFDVAAVKDTGEKQWSVTPKSSLPRNTQVHVELQTGLHSVGGDVPSPHSGSFSFHTFGPLTASVRCGWSECAPESNVSIELSNAITISELKKRVSITPKAALEWPDWYDGETRTTSVNLGFKGAPRTTYQLSIDPTLSDEYDQALQSPSTFTFRTIDYWSSLSIGLSGQILQPAAIRAVPVRSRNVADYDLRTVSADPPAVFLHQNRLWDGIDPAAVQVAPQRVNPGITNRFHDHLVDLSPSLHAQPTGSSELARGAVLITADYATNNGSNRGTERKLVQVTDLGMTAKLAKQGTIVWVTRMSTGKPLAGATVELWTEQRVQHTYTTDADGLVTIPVTHYVPSFQEEESHVGLVARYEGDWIAQSQNTFMGPWRMPIYPQLYPTSTKAAYMFTERGVYRPGDEVWVKGIVRDEADAAAASAGGMAVVSDRTFELQLFDANGTQISTHPVKTSAFGTFAHRLTVPASAALGSFRVALRDPTEKQEDHELPMAYFAVAEYEPAEFAVAARADKPSYINGAMGGFQTQASFLYGSPVANADSHYTITYEASAFQPPNSDHFETSDAAYQMDLDSQAPQYGLIAEGDATLDAQGSVHLKQELKVPGQVNPLNIRFESSVTDVSRRTLSGSSQTLLHPADFYIGIQRPEDWFVSAPSTFEPQVVAFSPTGQRLAGKVVELDLVRRRWASVREVWEGGYRQVYRLLDNVVAKCTLTTAQNERTCALALTEGGNYVVRAKSKDDGARPVHASLQFYAIGNGRADWRDDAVNAHMDLVANKKEYRVGETARILVKSPFESGEALVTVERSGVIEKRRVTLTGGTPVVEVPITEAMRPNAFVSVHLLKKRSQASAPATAGDELYRIGYTELLLDASQRKLEVAVTPKAATVRPREKVIVDVQVRDTAGKGKVSEVTFYAVDEGVLTLTGYQLPDPVSRFTAPRPLKVATIESRSDLARIFEPLAPDGSQKGAEGGDGGGARSDFKQSAYFNPTIVTDDNGRARVEFPAPDNLTTFRLMAVAVSKDDRYGAGQNHVVVSKPLMARPALPRFLRASDRFEAAVAVSTKAAKSKYVDVTIKVGGGLTLEGNERRRIKVSSDGVEEVRFPVVAQTAGEASFNFEIQGEFEHDSVRLTRTIHSPTRLETVAAYGETRSVEGQRLGKLDEVRSDVGGLQVTLASSRLVGLGTSMESLVEYPYYCTEQLASRLLPLLPLSALGAEFGFEPAPDARGFAERTVRLLLQRQRHDGGFGFWSESSESHPYLSAYTLWTLKIAAHHGVKVDAQIFQRGLSYLRAIINNPTKDKAELEKHGLSHDLQAFTAMVMSTLDAPDLGAIERLTDQRKDLGILGHAWLLMAAVDAKAPTAIRQPLVERLEASITAVGNRAVVENTDAPSVDALLSSPLKVQAVVLDALLAANPVHPLAGGLVAELLWRREGGAWRTTQESAFALLAIDHYWKTQEKERPRFDAKVWVGDKPLILHTFEGRSTKASVQELSMATLQASNSLDVVFERANTSVLPGAGTLFYEARLQYGRQQLPRAGLDRGFAVQKIVRAVTPAELSAVVRTLGTSVTSVDARQLALVDLLIVAPNARRFVAIDDPLPAGLTAVDDNLATSSQRDAEVASTTLTADGFSAAWSRRELRDDRVLFFVDEMPAGMYHFRYLAHPHTPGTYVVPETRAMEMYQPEVFGRTAATTLTVTSTQ